MLDIINDRDEIVQILRELSDDKKPLFGKMGAQQMIEHLIYCVTWSNGNNPQICLNSTRDSEKIKSLLIYTDREMKPGFRNPGFSTVPATHICDTMEEAIGYLQTELEVFDNFYRENPREKQIDPMLGQLTYKEWVTYHSKHFRHHLRQFDLRDTSRHNSS